MTPPLLRQSPALSQGAIVPENYCRKMEPSLASAKTSSYFYAPVRRLVELPQIFAGHPLLSIFITASGVLAEETNGLTASPAQLKELSLEELMNVEITSVSKREEKMTQAAASVHVITQDDVRRSGARSIPELLRLAPNLQVAQVNAREWAISARGFNGTLANKLLVTSSMAAVFIRLFSQGFLGCAGYAFGRSRSH